MNGWRSYLIVALSALVLAMGGFAWATMERRVTILETKYETVLELKADLQYIKSKLNDIEKKLERK